MVASRTILYDPMMTTETPRALWLSSGVMAVDHAVEVFCTSPPHLIGDTLKIGSLQQLFNYLTRTAQKPEELEARLRCQVAGWQADHSPLRAQPLSAASAPLYSHALAYELGALCRVPYGISACVTLPACLRWYAEHLPHTIKRQATLARSLQLAPREVPDEVAVEWLANGLVDFIGGLGLPTRLRETGMVSKDFERIAKQFAKRNTIPPQTGISVEAEVLRILENAW
jgi:alcohol dehydrogenase class IV